LLAVPSICALSLPLDICAKVPLMASTLPELSVTVALMPMLVKVAQLMTSYGPEPLFRMLLVAVALRMSVVAEPRR
jgi:hypothetical protein